MHSAKASSFAIKIWDTIIPQSGFKMSQLFNIILKYLRDLHDVDVSVFKTNLDLLLSSVPDEPTSQQGVQMRVETPNSLMHR